MTPSEPPFIDLSKMYSKRFGGAEEKRNAVWRVLVKDFFQRWVPQSATVADIGAGYCCFINEVQASRKLALDLNPNMPGNAAPDVSPLMCDLSKTWPIGTGEVDVCFSSNFIEHLPDKQTLVHCLQEAHRVLKDGGRLILLGPNIRFCYDVYWDFFDHFLPLSDRSMVEALENNDFVVEQSLAQFLPFTMQGGAPTHPALVSLYLRLPLFWPLLGKQFLLVARKPQKQRET